MKITCCLFNISKIYAFKAHFTSYTRGYCEFINFGGHLVRHLGFWELPNDVRCPSIGFIIYTVSAIHICKNIFYATRIQVQPILWTNLPGLMRHFERNRNVARHRMLSIFYGNAISSKATKSCFRKIPMVWRLNTKVGRCLDIHYRSKVLVHSN